MSADLLREAAALMRSRAEAATHGPWHRAESHWSDPSGEGLSEIVVINERCDPAGRTGYYPGDVLAFTYGPGNEDNDNCDEDAEHIASWHPAVALAVADWLDKSAETYERLEDDLRGLEGVPTIEQVYGYDFTEALTVARAYLGGAS